MATATPTFRLVNHCLPGYIIDSSSAQIPRDTTCSVCMNHIDRQQSVFRMLCCHHVFHEKCIVSWLSKTNTCPKCSRVILPDYRMLNIPLPDGFRLPPQPPDTMPLEVPEQQSDDGTVLCLNFYVRPESMMSHEKNLSKIEMEYLDKIFSTAGYPDDEMRHDLLHRSCAPFSVVCCVLFPD